MMKRGMWLVLACALGSSLGPSAPASAQHVDTFSARLRGARSEGGVLLPGSRLLRPHSWEASLTYGHAETVVRTQVPTGQVRGAGRHRDVDWIDSRDFMYLQLAVSPVSRLELIAGVPLLLHQDVHDGRFLAAPDAGSAVLGDVDMAVRYALFAPERHPFSWTVQTGLIVPSGREAFAFGDPNARFRAATTLGYQLAEQWSVRTHLGYQMGAMQRVGDQLVGDTLFAGAGVTLEQGPFRWNLEAITNVAVASAPQGVAPERAALEILAGTRCLHDAYFVDLGVGLGALDAGATPRWRLLASVGIHGLFGGQDRAQPDRVRMQPDRDLDNIADDNDACPTLAEDYDGYQDDDGCPDIDNDGDGVLDAADACPTRAEDLDGIQDEDGCPEDDADRDGIADPDDACPLAPEDYDGFEDEDGCPEPGAPDLGARLRSAALEGQAVYFQTGSNELDSMAQGTLREIVRLLKEREGDVVLVGHADERGTVALNEELSLRRAEAVRALLIEAGLAVERFTLRGAGPREPNAPGATDFGHSLNRRVTFSWAPQP